VLPNPRSRGPAETTPDQHGVHHAQCVLNPAKSRTRALRSSIQRQALAPDLPRPDLHVRGRVQDRQLPPATRRGVRTGTARRLPQLICPRRSAAPRAETAIDQTHETPRRGWMGKNTFTKTNEPASLAFTHTITKSATQGGKGRCQRPKIPSTLNEIDLSRENPVSTAVIPEGTLSRSPRIRVEATSSILQH
jgi:hypothetical protein